MYEVSRLVTAPGPTHTTRVPSATGSLQCMPRPASCLPALHRAQSPTSFAAAGPGRCWTSGVLKGHAPFQPRRLPVGSFKLPKFLRYAVMVRVTVGICRWDQWCHLCPTHSRQHRGPRLQVCSPSSHSLAGGHTAASTSTSQFPIQPEVGHSSDCAAAAATRVS